VPSREIAVFMKGYLGDAVMATPLLQNLLDQGFHVHALTEPAVVQLLKKSFPEVNFLHLRDLKTIKGFWGQVRDLKSLELQTILLTNRSFRSALAARFAGIPQRIGHATEGRGWLLTQKLEYSNVRNEALCYLDLAEAAGIQVNPRKPCLKISEEDRQKGIALLQGADIGVQPGARSLFKQVPVATTAAVVRTLQKEGHRIALFGGPEEKSVGEELASMLDEPATNLIGAASLSDTPGVLSNLKLMIGSDTGLMHIAAASGVPTVTSFGPTTLQKWGCSDPPHQIVVAKDRLIRSIQPEMILEAAKRALGS
jgi:heptosyltransferase-2